MATKADLLEQALERGLDVSDANTKTEIQEALDVANDEIESTDVPELNTEEDSKPEEPATDVEQSQASKPKAVKLPDTPSMTVRGIAKYWFAMVAAGEQDRAESELLLIRDKINEILRNFTELENV